MRWPDNGLWKGGDSGPGRNDLGSLDVLGLGDGDGLRGGTGFGGDLSKKINHYTLVDDRTVFLVGGGLEPKN
jgi:hypothetical protein